MKTSKKDKLKLTVQDLQTLLLIAKMSLYKTVKYMKLLLGRLIINNFLMITNKIFKTKLKTRKKELYTLIIQIKIMNKNFYLII
jgi:hypothetical protein